jgi:hypothetical protein
MALQAMRFDRRRWSAVCDLRGIVHHGTRLTKKEAQYQFCLADAVRAIVACGECGAAMGAWCVRKLDGQPMANHSRRVRQAKLLFELRILPRLDRLHRTLCSASGSFAFIIFGSTQDRAVDCMACLVAAARQGG